MEILLDITPRSAGVTTREPRVAFDELEQSSHTALNRCYLTVCCYGTYCRPTYDPTAA